MSPIVESIITGLVDSLFSVLVLGLIVWWLQKRYERNEAHRAIYIDRIIRIEDRFYSEIRETKNSFYQMRLILTNNTSYDLLEAAECCAEHLTTATAICENEAAVLSKYKSSMDTLSAAYHAFVGFINSIIGDRVRDCLPAEDFDAANKTFTAYSDVVIKAFLEIDKIYYGKQKRRGSH